MANAEIRFVLSTKPLEGKHDYLVGRRLRVGLKLQHRFGLHRFGQGTLRRISLATRYCLYFGTVGVFINQLHPPVYLIGRSQKLHLNLSSRKYCVSSLLHIEQMIPSHVWI